MKNFPLSIPEILVPGKDIDLYKWAVIACDQFITDEEYWKKAEEIRKDSPSALDLILPEIYLSKADELIPKINENMKDYLKKGNLRNLGKGIILTQRSITGKPTRNGILICVDLEEYSTDKDSHPLIRPTEKTITSRIPPRMKIRENAPMEFPHILMLMDDDKCEITESLIKEAESGKLELLYDSELMLGGGRIKSYFIPEGKLLDAVIEKLRNLKIKDGMQFLVGDGNHSLATAKALWEKVKPTLTKAERETAPQRFALTELINIYDKGLNFQPIHRVLYGVKDKKFFIEKLKNELDLSDNSNTGNSVEYIYYDGESRVSDKLSIKPEAGKITVSQLDSAIEKLGGYYESIEYIHGTAELIRIAKQENTLAFSMPALDKHKFFDTVAECGVLPKKTFSLGEAEEKRYYIEGRLIK